MDAPRPGHALALFVVSLSLMLAPLAHAQEAAAAGPHVRPLTSGVDRFIAEGVARSPTIRELVARIDASDLIVYVRSRPFTSPLTTGHLLFLSATPEWRYVIVEIACGTSWNTQLATLGHELRHAVEVAEAADVRSAQDLARHYERIGTISGIGLQYESFETQAAADTGRRVGRELAGDAARRVAMSGAALGEAVWVRNR